jgi:recombination associated protein RdgC
MTVRRFRVVGETGKGWRDVFRDQLNEFAFREAAVSTSTEEVEGWVQVHNLLDASFDDFNLWLYGNYVVFALRVDKKSLPAKLFSATVQKRCDAWCAENDVERCPSAVKGEIKDALEREWLKHALPRVGLTEACWSIDSGYLILHSLSEGTTERFGKRFFRTFGMRLVPWSPLDFLEDAVEVETVLASAPASLQGVRA